MGDIQQLPDREGQAVFLQYIGVFDEKLDETAKLDFKYYLDSTTN